MVPGDTHAHAGPHGALEPRPDLLLERLDALERALQGATRELAVTRRTLSELARGSDADRAGEASRGAAGRASLRGSGLGVLFRSTLVEGEHASGPGQPQPAHAREESPAGAEGESGLADPSPESWLEGRAAEVEPQRAAMVANRERLLGPEHPDTLWAAHDLALALADAGETTTAWRLATRLLDVRVRTLGSEHPFTARASELQVAIAGLTNRAATA